MLVESLLIAVLATMCGGVFLELWVWVFRNPIIEGALVGLILGDWMEGAMIGATIQLIYMGQITVGGISSFDKCYAGVIATAVTMLSHQTPEVGVTIAVTLGTLGLLASNATMTVNVAFGIWLINTLNLVKQNSCGYTTGYYQIYSVQSFMEFQHSLFVTLVPGCSNHSWLLCQHKFLMH